MAVPESETNKKVIMKKIQKKKENKRAKKIESNLPHLIEIREEEESESIWER